MLKYPGRDVQSFFRKAEKLYRKVGFGDKAQYGMILNAIKSEKKIMESVLFRGDKSVEKIKDSCLEYQKNQNVHVPDESNGSKEINKKKSD